METNSKTTNMERPMVFVIHHGTNGGSVSLMDQKPSSGVVKFYACSVTVSGTSTVSVVLTPEQARKYANEILAAAAYAEVKEEKEAA